MNRWDALTTVSAYLRAGFLGGEPLCHHSGISWERLVEASSQQYVTPALAWCLKNQVEAPGDVREYFAAVLGLNAERNEALYNALTRIVAACNAIGIAPMPLKGAARLVEGTYPSRSLRFLGDLDLLIPEERSADTVAALQDIGFDIKADDAPTPPNHHHLPMLHDSKAGGGVELHTKLTTLPAGLAVLPTDWFAAGARPIGFEGLNIRLPDVTRGVAHIIVHDHFQHQRIQLRQLLDIAMIRTRHEDAIDWMDLDRRFCRAGAGEVLATYLALGELLLGQPMPRLSCAPRRDWITLFRRKTRAPRLVKMGAIISDYVAQRRRNPADVLKLFNLRRWPARIRMVKAALDRTRWNS